MGVGQQIGDTLRVPGRGLRRGVAVVVVLVLAGATGSAVALTAPELVAGLRPAPAALPPAVPVPALGPLPADAPVPTAAGVAAALDPGADDMPGRFSGTVLDAVTGEVLWERTPDEPMTPGSTGKVLTAAAALLTLDPATVLVTSVVQGAEPGTVVLVGGGDPTVTTSENGVYPDAPELADLAAAAQQQATAPITQVLVDTSRYRGPTLAGGWAPGDVGGGFVAPIVPLMLDGGRIDPTLQDGPRVQDPALVAGRAFAELLDLGPDTVEEGTAPAGASPLASISSAPVPQLVEHLMRSSDNVLAEVLAREVAIARDGEPSFAGAAEETAAALSQAGFDPAGAVLADASGLSRDDRVPARLLGTLMAAAAAPAQGEDSLRPILTGLPVAGGDGTLDERFGTDDDSAAGRGVVRAKTGTLTGVSSLAGVVTDADGRLLVFALMSNGGSTASVRARLDELAAALSRCGCR